MSRALAPSPRPPRGLVRLGRPPGRLTHGRWLPGPRLAASIEHFWYVTWALPAGVRHVQASLGHPVVHVVVEGGAASVVGVSRGRHEAALEGRGWVLGTKFLPGAFRPLLGAPVSSLTGRRVPLADVLGARRAGAYLRAVLAGRDGRARMAAARGFWEEALPPPAGDLELLGRILDAAATDRAVRRVEDLVERFGLSRRELQRWFRDVVGIGPKWAIARYRLHEALLALEAGAPGGLGRLAHDLGYADQAHFARDFRALVGMPPSEYLRRQR
ncbi:MAG: helix-turn-helix domain-containing protein [Anaeromyxobacteraceae bacterium]